MIYTPFLIFFLIIYLYWRFIYFFRDPKRIIPQGKNIISPADGTIVYVHNIASGIIPISVKNKREIHLTELLKNPDYRNGPHQLVGIFMHPTSVHINRAPISGLIKQVTYTPSVNLPMTKMWWRVLLRRKPFEKNSAHIIENSRNVIEIVSEITIFVIQIADIYVSKILCLVKNGDKVEKGQKVGSIVFGSQVDLVLPSDNLVRVVVKPGNKVRAGESIIAEIIK